MISVLWSAILEPLGSKFYPSNLEIFLCKICTIMSLFIFLHELIFKVALVNCTWPQHADDSEDDSDIAEPSEDKEEGGDAFMQSYSDALNTELKQTTVGRSFIRANEEPLKKDEVYPCVLYRPCSCIFYVLFPFLESFRGWVLLVCTFV